MTPLRPVAPDRLAGLVFGGGADVTEPLGAGGPVMVEPSRARRRLRVRDALLGFFALSVRLLLGTRRHGVDTRRDGLELALVEHARLHGLPVLGICRGAQLMNLAEGGSLLRRVREFYEERPDLYTVFPRLEVRVTASSRLSEIVGTERLLVNSLHFHAIREAAPELRIVARETWGIAQAIEHPKRPFWLGVQWHPEYLPQRRTQQALFRALVECAGARAASSETDIGPLAEPQLAGDRAGG